METQLRSLLKTISWRTWALFITAFIGYAMTGKWGVALALGTVDTLVKFLIFYFHERLWNMLPIGRRVSDGANVATGAAP